MLNIGKRERDSMLQRNPIAQYRVQEFRQNSLSVILDEVVYLSIL